MATVAERWKENNGSRKAYRSYIHKTLQKELYSVIKGTVIMSGSMGRAWVECKGFQQMIAPL